MLLLRQQTREATGLSNATTILFDLPGVRVRHVERGKAGDRARFENSVLNGKNQMPPWKGVIDKDQLELLWSYIRANAYQK